MIIIYLIIGLLLFYYIFGGILIILGIIFTTKRISKEQNKHYKGNLKNKYYILLPVYYEQKIIEESIDYFYSIFKNNKKVKVLIIATERENCINSTYAIAKKIIENKKADNILVLKAPKKYKNKVGQINYVLKCNLIDNDAIVAIYDIDSRPDKKILEIVDNLLEKNKSVNIFQQVSSYCNNLNNLIGINKIISASDALAQTKWSLGFEYQLYLLYNKLISKNKLRPLVYCIGHGLYVRNSFLKYIDGFSEVNPNDDLSFGYQASVLGECIIPIPLLDKCNISFDYKETVSQYKYWSKGSNLYYQDIKFYKKKHNIELSKKQEMIFFLQGLLRNLLWAWRSLLWLIIMIISCYLNNKSLVIFCFFGLFVYVIMPQIIVYIELKKMEKIKIENIFLSILFSPINFLLRGIGPTISLIYRILRKDKEINYKSTR